MSLKIQLDHKTQVPSKQHLKEGIILQSIQEFTARKCRKQMLRCHKEFLDKLGNTCLSHLIRILPRKYLYSSIIINLGLNWHQDREQVPCITVVNYLTLAVETQFRIKRNENHNHSINTKISSKILFDLKIFNFN